MKITRKIGPLTKYMDQKMGLHPLAEWFHPCASHGSYPAQVWSPSAKRWSHQNRYTKLENLVWSQTVF